MRGTDRFSVPRARRLRRDSTLAEARLWEQLRGKRFEGVKFARQHPVGPYFADFAARSRKLIVEVDGATHSTDEELRKDAARTVFLEAQGYRVVRVSNNEVLNAMDEVLTLIREALDVLAPRERGEKGDPSASLG
jgi:very-short-patch-repair endonuclease